MSRELKFKYIVVRKNGHVFSEVFTLNEIQNNKAYSFLSMNIVAEDELYICEFTGLFDKNGLEIYNGDIVGGYPHGTVQVRWCDEYACFESYWIETEYDEAGESFQKEMTGLLANDLKDCKDEWVVLGDIYQHPELITNA